ncbi:MAG: hypothetical protein KBD66_04230 [Candidatus Doudnabacteria bacterium]|nr:hypothetical protein [Candidatus Doudnabacteria bacterium]
MPRRSPIKTDFAQLADKIQHPLERHRSIVTMGIGFAVLLGLMTTALASSRVRNSLVPHSVKQARQAFAQPTPVDTISWKTYTDGQTKLSFQYPSSWNIALSTPAEAKLITIASPKGTEGKITIYQSSESYLGFEGLPETDMQIAGQSGVSISNGLVGFKKDGTYYTFDAGLDQQTVPIFQELIKSLKFE